MNSRKLWRSFFVVMLGTCSTYADSFGSGANEFTMDFVTIGSPGNAADTTGNPSAAGSVPYTYRIGKFEVPEDAVRKANALGGFGISIDARGLNKPATSVNWFEAALFVNWLNTSEGHTPAYKFNGDNFELWQASDAGYDPENLFRNSQAFYCLPSVNEWYKAAYYDSTTGVYYDYPTASDTEPDGIDFEGDSTFDAVFFDGGRNLQPNEITNVGALSPYGTAGQGGNVWEWEETEIDLVNNSTSANHAHRGGLWDFASDFLRSTARRSYQPSYEDSGTGFRVASIASIPEPSAVILAIATLLGGAYARLHRRKTITT